MFHIIPFVLLLGLWQPHWVTVFPNEQSPLRKISSAFENHLNRLRPCLPLDPLLLLPSLLTKVWWKNDKFTLDVQAFLKGRLVDS